MRPGWRLWGTGQLQVRPWVTSTVLGTQHEGKFPPVLRDAGTAPREVDRGGLSIPGRVGESSLVPESVQRLVWPNLEGIIGVRNSCGLFFL